MVQDRRYFFCGIGGSGMLPLAMIVKARGFAVAGSDRALDQGQTAPKFDFLRSRGIKLFAQDGSGIENSETILVTSTAVEDTVPDVKAARHCGASLITRAELLAALFNDAPTSIGIAGTSGKSTTTGMIGWILHQAGRDPTVMNGAVMKNFVTPSQPFASALVGKGPDFVAEVDESDGSIAHYRPTVAVLNNIAVDHKSLDELRLLFAGFCEKAKTCILNLDNDEVRSVAGRLEGQTLLTYSLTGQDADLMADHLVPSPDGIGFTLTDRRTARQSLMRLRVPGAHNVANALAALLAAEAAGIPLDQAISALADFSGLKRRLEGVGTAAGVTVIDDFAHNPDKIAATLSTLHAFPGRLLILFQPHGFGPLRQLKDAFIQCFLNHLAKDDILIMPEPVYFGGTVDRSISSQDIIAGLAGRQAWAYADRTSCRDALLAQAQSGDRILVMGARDDSLSQFALDLLPALEKRLGPINGNGDDQKD
ncbi:MAG TPA: UDP-N-acetylmuramate--alanine ligase [Rhodospirillaceae bacterium]|nr:UDP-N-acetylmuramate--alanine ligase [Rhodospirillaceae bacterium]